jgi:type IV pilus assembly protein PilM
MIRLSPIGIDVGSRAIKAAQLARAPGGWRLHAEAVLPLPAPATPDDAPNHWAVRDALVGRLLEVLDRRGFAGNKVVLSVPPSKLESDLLELPPRSSGAPIEQIARGEIARASALSGAPFEMACWDLPAPERATAATAVLAVAVRHTDAETLIAPFERGGVNVVALDTASWALARSMRTCAGQPGTATAVVDLGFSGSTLVLLGDGRVLYQRHLRDAGVGAMHRTVAERFDGPEDAARLLLTDPGATGDPTRSAWIRKLISGYVEHLIDELQVSFAFAAHRYPAYPLRKLLLTGGGAALAGAADSIRSRLPIDVAVPPAAELVDVPTQHSGCADSIVHATAIGLAMHGRGGAK